MSFEATFDATEREPEDLSIQSEVLGAVKEASVHIMKKFSIDVELMKKAAIAIQDAFARYQKSHATDDELAQLRNLAVDVMEEALSAKQMHTPEIMQEFEKALHDKLPE